MNPKNETTPTATPWYLAEDQDGQPMIGAGDDAIAYMAMGHAIGSGGHNAAYIVRCVNSHVAIVEALRLAVATIDRLASTPAKEASVAGTRDLIKAALAEAGEA